MNKKVVLTALFLIALVGMPAMVPTSAQPWTDPAEWYMTIEGLLDADYYTLYPFEIDESLTIGFSKFGEMINSIDNVGLEYRSVDPFAPPAGSLVRSVPKTIWLQGWLINVTYTHVTKGQRNVWACALHADTVAYGGPWLRVDFPGDWSPIYGYETPDDPGYIQDEVPYRATDLHNGGRKTNGTAYTYPIKIIYEGPRKIVIELRTDIYDHFVYENGDTSGDIPLVAVVFTIIFNKVKKQVNIIKDVKSLMPDKVMVGKMNVQFSNRGEIDLGNEGVGYKSYVHFYTQGNSSETVEVGVAAPFDTKIEGLRTVYGESWALVLTNPGLEFPPPEGPGPEKTGAPTSTDESSTGHFPQPDGEATFDLIQAINPDVPPRGVVWFGAFWPSLSDWTVDGWPMWWRSMDAKDPHKIDLVDTDTGESLEPEIPFYIAEWDFELDDVTGTDVQFRGVAMYGVIDRHDADDLNLGRGDVIDSEVLYFCNEEFNPWDLEKATDPHDKDTARYVEFFDITEVDADGNVTLYYTPVHDPVDWDAYSVFAERLLLLCPYGYYLLKPVIDYNITYATGEIHLADWVTYEMLYYDCVLKVLYSVDYKSRYEWIVVGRDAKTTDVLGAAYVAAALKNKGFETWMMGLDMMDDPRYWRDKVPWVMAPLSGVPVGYDDRDVYYDWEGEQGPRPALKDHWCNPEFTILPIASSNLIAVGGPRANLLTEYVNEFLPVVYDGEKLISLSCWSKNAYAHPAYGGDHYAVIGVYKDLNGSVILTIWGMTGEDTYWAAAWFDLDRIIHALQDIKPGVVAIVLYIDYTHYDILHEPDICVLEFLGTKSETWYPELGCPDGPDKQVPPHPDP